jgi:crossover junction endodeoxyribonuclease RusA
MITLSWPDRDLSPNARKDRRYLTAKRKSARTEGWAAAQGVKIPPDAHLSITFHAPDRRRRDLDNLLASIKSHLDGVALAAGVDDAGWSFTIRKGDPVKGGRVVIEVGA